MKIMQTLIKIDETNEKSLRIFDVALKTRWAARSFKLQARGYEHHVWGLLPGSFRYVGGLSESGDFQLQMLHR